MAEADGVERIYAFAPAWRPGDGGRASLFVVMNVDRQVIVATGRQRLILQLSVLALVSLLGIWLAWLYAGQQVVRPARAILEATARLQGGQLDTRLPVPPVAGTEFSRIAEGLNQMAEALQEREHERLRSEEHLRETQRKLLDAQRIGRIGNWESDAATRRFWWSPEVYGLFGIAAGDFDETYGGFTRLVHPEDRPALEAGREAALRGGPALDTEFRITTPAGELRWMHVRGEARKDSNGAGLGLAGVVQDISQRKAVEARQAQAEQAVLELNRDLERKVVERSRELARQEAVFRAVADHAPQVMWIVNSKGAVTWLNRYWYDLVGGAHPKWLGHEWAEAVDPEDVAEMRAKWKVSAAEHSVFTGIRRVRAIDGTIHTLAYRASPVYDDAGSITSWVGLDADITEIKQIENALRLSNQELETFSYSVSHDLRSPLNTIDGFSRMLEKDLKTNEGRKADHYLSRIQAAANHMGQLIEGLLALAQVSRQNLKMGSMDLSAMCEEIAERLRRDDPQRAARIVIEPGMDVYGDARMLRALLQNLMGNAWKFSGRQAVPTLVVGRILAQAKAPVYFVRDNGAGFDMQFAGKLFGAFQRLHREDEFSGTGIGLATVKRIVTRHAGAVWAESKPDEGATFFFTLNATERPDAARAS